MKTVWKFPLPSGVTLLAIPQGAQFLHADMQATVPGAPPIGETPTLWYLVDPSQPKEERTFVIVATGDTVHSREGALEHVGTVLTKDGGRFVWHIFEFRKT